MHPVFGLLPTSRTAVYFAIYSWYYMILLRLLLLLLLSFMYIILYNTNIIIYIYTCIYIYICVCVYVYIYISIYIYMHMHKTKHGFVLWPFLAYDARDPRLTHDHWEFLLAQSRPRWWGITVPWLACLICSMSGILTYIWVIWWQMLVNIPAPWSICMAPWQSCIR